MTPLLVGIVCGTLALAPGFEVDAVVRGVDAGAGMISFHAAGMDRSAKVAPDATFTGEDGKPLDGGLRAKALAEGAAVTLTIERVDNKPLVRAVTLGRAPARAASASGAAPGAAAPAAPEGGVDTSALVALTDLGESPYRGFPGGLYPGGKNTRPAAHDALGRAAAARVRPLDAAGTPDPGGKIVLLGVGFSNTVQAFGGFTRVAAQDDTLNPSLVLVNGAVGGMSAAMVSKPDEGRGKLYWETVDERLKAAGVTRAQVQAVWVKETNPGPHAGGFPAYVKDLQGQLVRIVTILHRRFPNAGLVYLSSRTYGGWARNRPNGAGPGNSEPYSYESGFAVKWLIGQQIDGDPALRTPDNAPWLSWGPYLWANGTTPRGDGFRFEKSDFMANDLMHESPAGQLKVGAELLRFFKTDATTRGWFVRETAPPR